MPGRYLRWLVIFAAIGIKWLVFSTKFIDQALISGEFLEYDSDLNTYRSGLVNNALFKLKENIERLRYMEQTSKDILMKFVDKYKDNLKYEGELSVNNSVNNTDLMIPMALMGCQQNIVMLSIALVKALDGNMDILSNLTLNPVSPLSEEAERLKKETATVDEVIEWINEL